MKIVLEEKKISVIPSTPPFCRTFHRIQYCISMFQAYQPLNGTLCLQQLDLHVRLTLCLQVQVTFSQIVYLTVNLWHTVPRPLFICLLIFFYTQNICSQSKWQRRQTLQPTAGRDVMSTSPWQNRRPSVVPFQFYLESICRIFSLSRHIHLSQSSVGSFQHLSCDEIGF